MVVFTLYSSDTAALPNGVSSGHSVQRWSWEKTGLCQKVSKEDRELMFAMAMGERGGEELRN